ncbi:Craniofacial development protein 2 [Varanus komodoensis]|nr:Craniofacial development protein 2 [Varanus komodoensis]
MDSTKRQRDTMPEDEPLRSEGVQYATGEERRASTSSARKSEATGSKLKGHSVADVCGGERRVVKQEMTRLNIDILGISELKWTGMGEFNSDDHQVYYCGQESLGRNGEAFIVNKRVGKAVLGYNLQNDRMISVRIQGKPFNITIVQVSAPTTGAEEAGVGWFYEGLQHLLELAPKNDVLIIMGDWNAKVGSQKITRITGKFALGVQNEAGHRLVEFCQENMMVIANIIFQQPKRRLYTWTSPDGQHRNQIDYVLCSQRWRSSIQSVKTRPGADCGSDHELLVATFRLKLKKVGKSTRPLSIALLQGIPPFLNAKDLSPSQSILYIGAWLDSISAAAYLPEYFSELRASLINSQPADKQEVLHQCFRNLMEGVEQNLLIKNRDRYVHHVLNRQLKL